MGSFRRNAWPCIIPASLVALHLLPANRLPPTEKKERPSREPTVVEDHPPRRPATSWDIAFEVWNPITGSYEPKASLDDGLFRMGEVAEQVRVMWVQHDPARAFLKDAPDPAEDDDTEWAEFRVSAQAKLVYETRNFDQRAWKKVASCCPDDLQLGRLCLAVVCHLTIFTMVIFATIWQSSSASPDAPTVGQFVASVD